MTDKMRSVTVDGISVEFTDQGAQVVEKLQRMLADANARCEKLVTDHAAAIKTANDATAKVQAALDDAKTKQLDAAAIDKLVAARAGLLESARLVAKDAKFDGLDDVAIRRAAVVAALGDKSVEGRDQAYVDARFEILVEDARKNAGGSDGVRDALRGQQTSTSDERPKAYQDMLSDISSAWKPKAAA